MSAVAAPRLEQLMKERATSLGESKEPSDAVAIVADVTSNSLLVAASPENVEIIRGLADVLAEVISARAAAHGFDFVDGRTAFSGHEICAPGDRWLHSVTVPVDESYHPTATGQGSGYYPALVGITG